MRREGRQHGMVRTHRILPPELNPRPRCLPINRFDMPSAGMFVKVSSKPTNHSKSTGKCEKDKCRECHMKPSGKAKEKAKGSQKLFPRNFEAYRGLVFWGIIDNDPSSLKVSGLSATEILGHLSGDNTDDYMDDLAERNDPSHQDAHAYEEGTYWKHDDHDQDEHGKDVGQLNSHDGDEYNMPMSFNEVGITINNDDGDEGWCLL